MLGSEQRLFSSGMKISADDVAKPPSSNPSLIRIPDKTVGVLVIGDSDDVDGLVGTVDSVDCSIGTGVVGDDGTTNKFNSSIMTSSAQKQQ